MNDQDCASCGHDVSDHKYSDYNDDSGCLKCNCMSYQS